jgi:hypothetical protein
LNKRRAEEEAIAGQAAEAAAKAQGTGKKRAANRKPKTGKDRPQLPGI